MVLGQSHGFLKAREVTLKVMSKVAQGQCRTMTKHKQCEQYCIDLSTLYQPTLKITLWKLYRRHMTKNSWLDQIRPDFVPLTRKVWDPFGEKLPLSDLKGVVATTSLTGSGQPRPLFPGRSEWHHWTHPKSALRKSTIISFNLHFSRTLTLPINSFIHPHTAVRNWEQGCLGGWS